MDDTAKACTQSKTSEFLSKNNDSAIRVRSLIGGLDKPRLRNPSNHLAGDTLFDLLFGDFSKFSTFDLEHKSSDLIFVRHKRTRRHTLDPSGGSASEMLLELVLVVSQFCARRRDRGAINDSLWCLPEQLISLIMWLWDFFCVSPQIVYVNSPRQTTEHQWAAVVGAPTDAQYFSTTSLSQTLEFSPGSLGFVTGSSGRAFHGVFEPQTLSNVGESLDVSFDFTTPDTVGTNDVFRYGLFNTGTNPNTSQADFLQNVS